MGTASLDYDEAEFLTAEGSNSGGTSDTGSTSEPDPDQTAVLVFPSINAIKGTVGAKFFINNRSTFDVGYTRYDVDSNPLRPKTKEKSIDVKVSYFPRKNFGVSFVYESADVTGEPTYNIQATVRW